MKTSKNTSLLLLLLIICLLAPTSVQAQSGNPGQPWVLSSQTESAPTVPEESTPAQESSSAAENGWDLRIGILEAFYHSGATIGTSGGVIPGATAIVSNNFTALFDVRRYIMKNLSLSLMGGVPPKPRITGEGAVASLGQLGEVRYGSAILTANYHLPQRGGFRPYVGGGTAYAIILKEHDGAVSQLKAHNNWGSVLQAGVEHEFGRKLALFADFKEVWLAVNAHGALSGGVPVTARVKLNPSLVSVGIRLHLNRGWF